MPLTDIILIPDAIELPELDEDPSTIVWETHTDLPDVLTFRITDDGRLARKDAEYEAVDREDRPYPDASEGTFEAMVGAFEITDSEWSGIEYTGTIPFGGTIDGEWFCYEATFTDGELQDVERVSDAEYAVNE